MDTFSIVSIMIIVFIFALGAIRRFTMTYLLIMGNLVIYFLTIVSFSGFGSYASSPIQLDLGLRPVYLASGDNIYTLFTHMFVHSTIAHVIVNMLFLFLIGVQLESRIGKGRFTLIFVIAGLAGGVLQSLVDWGTGVLIIGASGAISGVMGAMILLYPRDETPMFLGPLFLPRVPVWMSVGSWFAIQVVMVFLDSGPVAYSAHIGGFLAGMVLAQIISMKKPAVERVSFDVGSLEPLATTPEMKNAIRMIKNAKEEDVRKAWLEYFAERARCPKCGSEMVIKGNKLICSCGNEVLVK
ncbi:MAG: rhomboid family intramembrane serine protease [Methanomassiliicoccales archaeon]|nr:rhomboid family intramembrane serine protease [Methanomassiliicoccales archaeon]